MIRMILLFHVVDAITMGGGNDQRKTLSGFDIFGEDSLPVPSAPCDLLQSCLNPSSCSVLDENPPPAFEIEFNTTKGVFIVDVVTAWAPPYATRLWHLSRLDYFHGASFYRVLRRSAAEAFVVQFGYRGDPDVDNCWDTRMTVNATWPVHPPGNQRGYVSFAMGAANQTGRDPNCTASAASYCARGFSTNIFVNLADNRRLDPPGFAVVGAAAPSGLVLTVPPKPMPPAAAAAAFCAATVFGLLSVGGGGGEE